jgi:alpha-glucosidase
MELNASVSLKSPDGKIRFTLNTDKEGNVRYNITYNKTHLIKNAGLGLILDGSDFSRNLQINCQQRSSGEEKYNLVVGKASQVKDLYNRAIINMTNGYRKVELEVKVFNSGLGFRYNIFPTAANDSCIVNEELTTFNLAGDPLILTMYLGSYTTSHEGFYNRIPASQLACETLMEMPTLVTFPDGTQMAITEAAVRGYAGMYLMRDSLNNIRGMLSPFPNNKYIKVKLSGESHSPWRTFIIGSDAGSLISSNLLTSLNEPCIIEDTSWIKPGKTTFPWWNGNVVPDGNFLPGNNFATNKYYIDWCSKNGIDFHNIYGYAEQPWYIDPNMNFETPSPKADVTTPVKSLDMDAISKYASENGVGLHLWVNWKPLYAKLDSAMVTFEKWGVKGLMVDFMDRDDQEMIQIQEEILKAAALHHIFIQFHGSSKPSGLNRTYPNEFAREGTRNYECYKWSRDLSADFDIAIPFTRLLAGVTDYHLGGFRAATLENFTIRYTNPLVTNTRCHMLGMYVVLECYLGMVCDTPMAYEGQQGFDFIKAVPTSWDETIVPAAEVMEYACVARRSGNDWYIGAINNTTPRTVSFPLSFLSPDIIYNVTMYCDAADSDINPNNIDCKEFTCKAGDIITLDMVGSGGAALQFIPTPNL